MPVLLIFTLLCMWEASQWLLPALSLEPLPFLWLMAASFTLLAFGLGLRERVRIGEGRGAWLGLLSALAVGAPMALLAVAQRYFAAEVAVAALAGVPVVMVVTAQVLSTTDDGAADALLPAIAGLAGALLLIPVGLPGSALGWIGFGLDLVAVLLAGVFGVLAHRAATAKGAGTSVLQMAIGNAITLVVVVAVLSLTRPAQLETYAAPGSAVVAISLAADVLTALAMLLLLREQKPLGFASRFLIIPLLGAVEAYLSLQPTLSIRAISGLLLMAGAATLLLRSRPMQAGSVVPMSARPLD